MITIYVEANSIVMYLVICLTVNIYKFETIAFTPIDILKIRIHYINPEFCMSLCMGSHRIYNVTSDVNCGINTT